MTWTMTKTILPSTSMQKHYEVSKPIPTSTGCWELTSTWIPLSSNNDLVRFPSLLPGKYAFEVKAINEDGVGSTTKRVSFYIDAPFYRKWWFYLLVTAGLIVLVSLIFMIRIREIRKQNKLLLDKEQLEKKFSQSQLTALRSQMNPHFVFNALNSIQDYIVSSQKEEAGDYLGLFADLMRKYLNQSQQEEISLKEEIETLEMYLQLEKIRFEETLSYSLEVSPKLNLVKTKVPVMLTQPLIENAIKHGLLHKKEGRQLRISFGIKTEDLVVTVIDNGIGRKRSAEINRTIRKKGHEPFASSALQKRIELINKEWKSKIKVRYTDLSDGQQPTGTKVEVIIPLKLN